MFDVVRLLTAKAVSQIFDRTEDQETRRLCLNGLYRINNERAKKELVSLYEAEKGPSVWRVLIAELLRDSVRQEQRIAPADAKAIASFVGL